MTDPKSRARVNRIVRGEFRPDDLSNLFLYARDHCDGREAVVDIGDFVAHHNERNKGIITRKTREWALSAQFLMSQILTEDNVPRFHENNSMPSYFNTYLGFAISRLDPKTVRMNTTLSRLDAQKVITKISKRMTQNSDGTWKLPDDMSSIERKTIDCVKQNVSSGLAFDASRLCSDFKETLRSNGLIQRDELRMVGHRLDKLVQLFAVSIMHNARIILHDGETSQMYAQCQSKTVEILAPVPIKALNLKEVAAITPIFVADLDPSQHCHKDLLNLSSWKNIEIELTESEILEPLR